MAVEKKNADFLSWFLDLVRYFTERRAASSSSSSSENPWSAATVLVRQIVNTPAGNGATALHVAAALRLDGSSAHERTRILQLLLRHGAEFVSRTDYKLRTELAKDPAVFYLFNIYLIPPKYIKVKVKE